jgi:hypothetical protein
MSTGQLPDDFADQLAKLLAPGEAEAAAGVIAEAAELDDEQLAGFLERFAYRVSSSDEPITAAELRSLLAPSSAG